MLAIEIIESIGSDFEDLKLARDAEEREETLASIQGGIDELAAKVRAMRRMRLIGSPGKPL